MQTNARTVIQPMGNDRTIGDRVRDMMAYIVSPGRRRAPTRTEFAQVVSTSFGKYHAGVVKLIEAAAAMFSGGERTGASAAHGSGVLDPVGGSEAGKIDSVNDGAKGSTAGDKIAGRSNGIRTANGLSTSNSSGHQSKTHRVGAGAEAGDDLVALVDDYLKDLEQDPTAFSVAGLSPGRVKPLKIGSRPSQSIGRTRDSTEDDIIGLIDDHLRDFGHESGTHTISSPIKSTPVRGLALRTPRPTSPQANRGYMRGREPRYAGQLTLPVPGKLPSNTRLPSEAARAVRELYYEQKASTSTRLRYTACELADRRIFLQEPTEDPQMDGAYPSRSRVNRETCVGPLRRQWAWGSNVPEVPAIKITRPEDVDSLIAQSSNQGGDESTVSNPAPARRTRGRSNAIWVPPPSRPLPSCPVVNAPSEPSPRLTPSNVSPVEPMPTPAENVPPMTPAAQLARKMRGRPTSMSEWLNLFSAGSNPFVDEKIVATAAPLIESALMSPPPSPISPSSDSSSTASTSSPESSPPCTPPAELKSLPLVKIAEEPTQSENVRRRARCSYDGGKYDLVVVPVIPDELMTEEIGVAC